MCSVGRLGGDVGELVGGRPRHVDLRRVGVAGAQLADRLPLPGGDAALDPPALVEHLDRRAGADHVVAAHALDRDLDAVLEARVQLGRKVQCRIVAGAVVAARGPAVAVELVQRADLPVGGPRRLHAHDLGAGAAPADRPVVAVAPVEAHRVLGSQPLGERLVVEPRLAAVGGRGQRERAGEREPDQRGDAEAGPQRQPLEPQEADGQHGQRHAQQQRAGAAHRDHRRGGEHEQHGQRQERIAAGAAGARPQRQQPGDHHQPGAEQLQHERRPRVGALVGQPHGAQRLAAAHEARAQLVQPARPQQPEVEARREIGGQQPGQRRADHRERAPALGHPLAGDDRGGGEHRQQHPEQRPPGRQAADHPLPLRDAEERERREPGQPRDRHRQQRGRSALLRRPHGLAGGGDAHRRDSRRAAKGPIKFWRTAREAGHTGLTASSRPPARPGAARSGGSCRSASWAARRRTRSCAGRRRRTAGRARATGSP